MSNAGLSMNLYLPPTVNHAYRRADRGGTGVARSDKYLGFISEIEGLVYLMTPRPSFLLPLQASISLAFRKDWTALERQDADNRVKTLFDALAQPLGIDDCVITFFQVRKTQNRQEHCRVMLWPDGIEAPPWPPLDEWDGRPRARLWSADGRDFLDYAIPPRPKAVKRPRQMYIDEVSA